MTIKFGTDGWRAVISDEFTFSNVRKVAQAIADMLNHRATENGRDSIRTQPSMVVGYDTRFLSDRYAWAVAEVLAANGIHTYLTEGDAPTPIVSHAIVHHGADGGVMITASHNPPRYNGIKLKAAYGGSAHPADAEEVERLIAVAEREVRSPQVLPLDVAVKRQLVTRFDPFPAYEKHLRTLVNLDVIRASNLRVAVDAMYGAGRTHLRRILEDAGCRVTELRGEMNPGFNGIHPEPIARHLAPLIEEMINGDYRIGLATDGDADRIGAVDPSGRFIDPHCIMALLLEHLVHDRGLKGDVVKTVSTTQMLNLLAKRYGLSVCETPVGFNHISDLMLKQQVLIGGEESGGISVLGHIPEGDGILMGLLLVEMVATRNRTLVEMLDELMDSPEIGYFYYARSDQAVAPFDKAALVTQLMHAMPGTIGGYHVASMSDLDGVKYVCNDGAWLLIRPSGTEPVLRIYAEGRSERQVEALLEAGGQIAQRHIGTLTPA